MSVQLKRALIICGAIVGLVVVGFGYVIGVNALLVDGMVEGDVEKVRVAGQLGASVDEGMWHESAPLMVSIAYSSPEVTAALLELGADPDQVTAKGVTPLHYAAGFGSLEHLRLIANASKDLDGVDEWLDYSPMDYAIQFRKEDTGARVRILAEAGADPDGRVDGTTPMFYMAVFGEVDAVRALLEAGANPNGIRQAGREAHLVAAMLSDSAEILSLMIEYGLELVLEPDEHGLSDLHRLARGSKGGSEVLEVLLELGADPALRSEYYEGKTALELALEREELAGTALLERLQEVTPH